jgi:hypothetical protein
MPARITMNDVELDAWTSRAVAHGIGERLRKALAPEGPFPERLQELLDEMRAREAREDHVQENS